MLFKNVIVTAMAALFAGHAAAAAPDSRAALIATDANSACRCPNNCSHKEGSSCKYWAGSVVVSSKCVNGDGGLVCAH